MDEVRRREELERLSGSVGDVSLLNESSSEEEDEREEGGSTVEVEEDEDRQARPHTEQGCVQEGGEDEEDEEDEGFDPDAYRRQKRKKERTRRVHEANVRWGFDPTGREEIGGRPGEGDANLGAGRFAAGPLKGQPGEGDANARKAGGERCGLAGGVVGVGGVVGGGGEGGVGEGRKSLKEQLAHGRQVGGAASETDGGGEGEGSARHAGGGGLGAASKGLLTTVALRRLKHETNVCLQDLRSRA